MFKDSTSGAKPPANQSDILPDYDYESGRHMLFGSLSFVQATIKQLHKVNYAEPNDWSRPLPTGQPNEVMAILTKRVRLD
ncbi:hypothetical protein IQ260_26355 [Leptolyngbya cf. ectocarpi LEGE 11479]|uniref:Uncharacterized protein n=1 Tax=Leptolyngbya cf. ectocarpi LEGE 11479 TaxID=1828722 RepID=A0A928ZZA1_LEPEC|nr:hypothetical protein [Leptolyngbya ectocarpi]MBE9070168.1 hypothetical protein [Leptolyngbya cf. ectocarpi LEGE 11479]